MGNNTIEEKFAIFYDSGHLKNIVYKILKKYNIWVEEDKEDLVKDIYFVAKMHLGEFDEKKGKFITWFYSLAVNYINNYTKRKNKIKFSSLEGVEGQTMEIRDSEMTPEEIVLFEEEKLMISKAFDRLNDYDKKLLEDILNGKKQKEMAIERNMNYNTLRVDVLNARNHFKYNYILINSGEIAAELISNKQILTGLGVNTSPIVYTPQKVNLIPLVIKGIVKIKQELDKHKLKDIKSVKEIILTVVDDFINDKE